MLLSVARDGFSFDRPKAFLQKPWRPAPQVIDGALRGGLPDGGRKTRGLAGARLRGNKAQLLQVT